MKKESNINNPIKSVKVDQYINRNTLEIDSFVVSVIYGRRQSERARFKHIFSKESIACDMAKELKDVIVGLRICDIVTHPSVIEISDKFAPLANNYNPQTQSK